MSRLVPPGSLFSLPKKISNSLLGGTIHSPIGSLLQSFYLVETVREKAGWWVAPPMLANPRWAILTIGSSRDYTKCALYRVLQPISCPLKWPCKQGSERFRRVPVVKNAWKL